MTQAAKTLPMAARLVVLACLSFQPALSVLSPSGDDVSFVRSPVPRPPVARRLDIAPQLASQATLLTPTDWLRLLCEGLPSGVRDCQGVVTSDFGTFLQGLSSRLSASRQKRDLFGGRGSSGFWPDNSWSSWPNSWSAWDNFGSGPLFGNFYNRPVVNTTGALLCPSAVDQSLVYQLSPDAADYPAVDIGNAIVADPNLAACLVRELVFANAGPLVVVDDFRNTAQPACPYTRLRLWSYQSLQYSSRCWVLANFGDFYVYTQCTTQFCQNCTDSVSTGPGRDYRPYPSTVSPFQKLCITDYRALSFWAFCPNNPTGVTLVRDRIVVPWDCNCQRVQCQLIPRQ